MLTFVFFLAVFSSVSWLIYGIMFVNDKLAAARLWEQSSEEMLMLLAVVFLPILVIWMVFGLINQFITNRGMNVKQTELLKQLQKNQDYTDLVVRVMLDAEHEIKDGFVINKFDMFISDMNESLSEIIQRCNIASSAQLEQLWQRVRRGEKWTLGKAILDASKSQSTFNAWVQEKVNRDKVFRGTLLEFCSRYQNLLQLLEKHDRDRIFLRIIETGVFGKVYSIIAPLSEGLSGLAVSTNDKIAAQSLAKEDDNRDYASVLRIANMEEPLASESIVNVDKDDTDEDEFEDVEPKKSFFSFLNPFKSRETEEIDDSREQDPFFQALHNSFKDEGDDDYYIDKEPVAPSFSSAPVEEPKMTERTKVFGSVRDTLNSIKSGELTAVKNDEPSFSSFSSLSSQQNSEWNSGLATGTDGFGSTQNMSDLRAVAVSENSSSQQQDDDDDVAYPFGGWTDEDNYNK